jgi:hypothetical protein
LNIHKVSAREEKRREEKRREEKRREEKRREEKKTTPLGVSLMRSQVLYWAAQESVCYFSSAEASLSTVISGAKASWSTALPERRAQLAGPEPSPGMCSCPGSTPCPCPYPRHPPPGGQSLLTCLASTTGMFSLPLMMLLEGTAGDNSAELRLSAVAGGRGWE